mgnify:CR=1 FL=1
MKRGFTLVELIGVVVILALVALLAFPPLLKSINNKKNQISDASKEILYSATDSYVKSNKDTFPLYNGNVYCTTIDILVKEELLPTKVYDSVSGDEIPLNSKIEIKVENNEYKYNLNNECTNYTGPNAPELLNNMLPIKYSGSNWLIAQQTEKWYDYDAKEWANAVVIKNDVIKDISDNHNDITITNKYTNQDGMAYFDGVDDYLDLGNKNYDFGNSASMVLRFKLHSVNSTINTYLFGNWESAGFGFLLSKTGQLFFQLYNENVSNYITLPGSNIELDKWYTVVATYDGTTIKIYINGELYTSTATTGEIKPSNVQFLLGANPGGNDRTSEFTNFTVANAMVYDRTLSESEVANNFSNEITTYNKTDLLFGYDYFGSTSDYYKSKYLNKENTIVDESDIDLWYVWIPRYKYQLFNANNGSVNPQEIQIEFESGINSTGTVKCTDAVSGSGDVSEICTNASNGNWYTHPAFTFGNQELTGFWVGKFEISGTIDEITIKPNVSSLRGQIVSAFFTAIQNLELSYSLNGDSHMMKNMEWGAVTYLSHSKYGTCTDGKCVEVGINNNSNYMTGCGDFPGSSESTNCNKYDTTSGMLASTTQNIYGVYDMNGSAWEYLMGGIVNADGSFYSNNSGFIDSPSSKYYDRYTYDTSFVTHSRGKLGDATKEILKIYGIESGGWYGDHSSLVASSSSWIGRGGHFQRKSLGGIFYFGRTVGNDLAGSSRAVLVK